MKPFDKLMISLATVVIGSASFSALAAAQMAKDLIGTWDLVSVTYEQNGKTTEPYGAHPNGLQILGSDGRFSVIIVNSSLPKFASGSRLTGTAEENKAVVQGSLAYFGTYTASDADKTWKVKVEGATFPTWVGLSQMRNFSISGDELTITNHGGASGGGNAKVVWRRVK
jgi:hypothetical protein